MTASLHSGSFRLARNRDAWFVIRGYKYQIDLTILRWLGLDEQQSLHLESGEDIDLVNGAALNSNDDVDRVLEQVKHLDSLVTLRSTTCICAIANAVQHLNANPTMNLVFRFSTNADVTIERPKFFNDRATGIEVWQSLQKNVVSEPERSRRLTDLLKALRKLSKPGNGIDDATWDSFAKFVSAATIEDLYGFIQKFEWSTRQQGASQLQTEIQRQLLTRGEQQAAESEQTYARLFLHVTQCLSVKGSKTLNQKGLSDVLALPPLGEAQRLLLQKLTILTILAPKLTRQN